MVSATMLSLAGRARTLRKLQPSPRFISQSTTTRRSLSSYIVTPKQVHESLALNPPTKPTTGPRTIAVCAAWLLPNEPSHRTGFALFKRAHIPHARFFDVDAVKDHDSPYPHMLPTPEVFAEAMRDLGIRRDDHVVVYDSAELGLFSAPRVGWTFKAFGHHRVHVLNNFRLWIQQGYPVESGEPERVERTDYPVSPLDTNRVAQFGEVKELARRLREAGGSGGDAGVQILDARSHGRFTGSEPEPRPDTPGGHIPGAVNVPFMSLLDPTSKALLPKEDLRRVLLQHRVNPDQPIISSCATGVTAAVLDAALDEAGMGTSDTRKVYDGSWVEWTQRVDGDEGLITKGEA